MVGFTISQIGSNVDISSSETTSNLLTWSLWQLAENQDVQIKLREEISRYSQNYSGEVSVGQYDKMKYTLAFIKVRVGQSIVFE